MEAPPCYGARGRGFPRHRAAQHLRDSAIPLPLHRLASHVQGIGKTARAITGDSDPLPGPPFTPWGRASERSEEARMPNLTPGAVVLLDMRLP